MATVTSKRAVVLLSGGIDSTTCAAIAKAEGFDIFCLSFNYGQRHIVELESAKRVALFLKAAKHLILKVDLDKIGGSALTESIDIPQSRTNEDISKIIPVTYVPARNTIFLSLALAWAETLRINTIFIGVNAVDYSGYPDCRPGFVKAFEKLAEVATKAGVEGEKFQILAPLINMKKAEIIRKASELGIDLRMTLSCYDPSPEGHPCGRCDSCILRKKGFLEAGLKEHT